MTSWIVLILVLAVTVLPGAINGNLSRESVNTWYRQLKKPAWTPPGWLFGPVWLVLYVCMSVAVWMVWKEDPNYRIAFQLYVIQLCLNHSWTPLFFLLKKPGLAFVNIVLLWFSVLLTTLCFAWKLTTAAQLMVPYILWISFASLLNYRIWQDNS